MLELFVFGLAPVDLPHQLQLVLLKRAVLEDDALVLEDSLPLEGNDDLSVGLDEGPELVQQARAHLLELQLEVLPEVRFGCCTLHYNYMGYTLNSCDSKCH